MTVETGLKIHTVVVTKECFGNHTSLSSMKCKHRGQIVIRLIFKFHYHSSKGLIHRRKMELMEEEVESIKPSFVRQVNRFSDAKRPL